MGCKDTYGRSESAIRRGTLSVPCPQVSATASSSPGTADATWSHVQGLTELYPVVTRFLPAEVTPTSRAARFSPDPRRVGKRCAAICLPDGR
jgi:hypothetical protein